MNTLLSSLLFLLVLTTACTGQDHQMDAKSALPDKIDQLVSAYSQQGEYGKFNGSILVAHQGKVVYKKGVGLANREWNMPNEPDTKHRLASVSKQFTALLIVQLAAEKKLDLQKPVSTYLPDYPKDKADRITVHHLLTHTSGIPDYGGFRNYKEFERQRFSPKELVEIFQDLPLEFDPGRQYSYSNSGYALLGYLIEVTTGKSYEQVLQEKILDPLGMENSGVDKHWKVLKKRASGYRMVWGNCQNSNIIDMSLPYAAGAIYSTVEDLYLWDQALYANDLLPKAYKDLLFEKHIIAGNRHYGYGWFVEEMTLGNTNVEVISHGGGIDGFRTKIVRIPDSKSLIVLLNNTEDAPLFHLTQGISQILYDQAFELPRKSVAYTSLAKMEEQDLAFAERHYQKVKFADGYYLDENELIQIGYQFLHADQKTEALAIFKWCIEDFPKSFNAFDSYAEALMESGDKKAAIRNYKKSIELNPGNQNGLHMLENLGVDVDEYIKVIPPELFEKVVGNYVEQKDPINEDSWRISIEEEDGKLMCRDKSYFFQLHPISDTEFVNQNYGVTVQFDIDNPKEISLLFSERITFIKEE